MYTTNLTSGSETTSIGKTLNKSGQSASVQALLDHVHALTQDLFEGRVKKYIVDMTKALPNVEPLITINGSCVCSRGNISAICGEAKSKKTFLTSALVASAMAMPSSSLDNFKIVANNPTMKVLWVDTEQGEQHVRTVIERITRMTGAALSGAVAEPRLTTLALRELPPHERKLCLYEAMDLMPYDLVVIDGVADLQRNTNDLEESDALVSELMALSTKTNTHIICVLHTNPGSDKARGHLGSSLQRKAESVLFVHRAGDSSIVEPQFCRNEPFERFAFAVSKEGIPQLCDLPTTHDDRNEIVAIVEDVYGGVIERSTLINRLIENTGCAKNTAHMRLKRAIDRGLLRTEGDKVATASFSPVQSSSHEPFTPFTDSHVNGGVNDVNNVNNVNSVNSVNDVTSVTSVSDVWGGDMFASAGIAVEQQPIRPRAHYDDDDCPF